MIDTIKTVLEHWFLIVWVVAVGIGYWFGGRSIALAIATLGLAPLGYAYGKRNQKKNQDSFAQEINKEREKAYEEIDRRNTTSVDVVNRLRKRSY